jgi:hypothetical protein
LPQPDLRGLSRKRASATDSVGREKQEARREDAVDDGFRLFLLGLRSRSTDFSAPFHRLAREVREIVSEVAFLVPIQNSRDLSRHAAQHDGNALEAFLLALDLPLQGADAVPSLLLRVLDLLCELSVDG